MGTSTYTRTPASAQNQSFGENSETQAEDREITLEDYTSSSSGYALWSKAEETYHLLQVNCETILKKKKKKLLTA